MKEIRIPGPFYLTEHQAGVCLHIVAGWSYTKIGQEFEIGPRTVRFHLENAASRIKGACPWLKGSPRQIILGYYAEHAGVIAFEERIAVKQAA